MKSVCRLIYIVVARQMVCNLEVIEVFTKADWLILAAAFLSFLFSVSLWFGFGMNASKEAGVFVGIWVPSILSAGNYFRQAARAKRNV